MAVELANAGLTALVLLPSCIVVGFLDRTEAQMPFGAESTAIDIDADLAALLSG